MNFDDELFEQLRATNPHVNSGDSPQPELSKRARFEEITMQPHNSPTEATSNSPAATPAPWWRRPMVAAPSLAGLVAVIVAAAMVFSAATAPSALALVTEAAESSATFTSGRAAMTIEIREADVDDFSGSFEMDFAYEGDDYRLTMDFSGLAESSVDGFDGGKFETIQIGDQVYNNIPGLTEEDQYVVTSIDDEDDIFVNTGFEVNPDSLTPDNIADLLDRATDVSKVTSDDNVSTFTATIGKTVLQDIGAANLPVGLSLLADEGDDSVPDTLDMTITVNDGILEVIKVDIVGDTADGFVDGTVTTRFSEFGEPQNITAPPADQLTDMPDFDDFLPEGFEAIEELEERRPGLCDEAFDIFETGSEDELPDEAAFREAQTAFSECLIAEGEPEAAAAWDSMMQSALDSDAVVVTSEDEN